jgi:hypothetical protein
MRKGGGKAKGASFERELCKRLSLWVSGGLREDLFWRSAMSGGRSTVAAKKGKSLGSQAGDISAVDAMGQPFVDTFFVEAKFYKKLDVLSFFFGRGELAKFWRTAKKESARYDKQPLLIAKQNGFPPMAVMTDLGRMHLGLDRGDALFVASGPVYVYELDDVLVQSYNLCS